MEPVEEAQGAERGRLTPNPFSTVCTALYAAAWVLVMLQGWGARIGSNPTTWLSDPANTAARIVNRDLELASASERVELGQDLRRALYGSLEEVLDASILIQRDAAETVASRIELGHESVDQLLKTNARLSVLLAEAGRPEEAFEVAEKTRDREIEDAIRAIYETDPRDSRVPRPGAEPLARLAEAGLEDWLLERAEIRLLEGEGQGEARSALAISHQIEERGARWLRRSEMLTAANLLMIAAGALMLVALARGTVQRQSLAPFVVPWSSALGFAVLVRADFWNRLYFVSLAQLGKGLPDPDWLRPFDTWGTLFASLPLLWLVYRHLLAPAPGPLLEPFGISRKSLRLGWIVPIAAAALAIDLLGTTVLAWGSWGLGFEGHWAEGLDETLIWGSTREVIETCVDYMLWTPLFEELLFRGLLFFTLRNRFGAWSSALMSAVLFSAIHFYSLPGFLMTFWSGFVWAIAFEWTRSLLPGIVAHAIYNLFFVAGILLIYR